MKTVASSFIPPAADIQCRTQNPSRSTRTQIALASWRHSASAMLTPVFSVCALCRGGSSASGGTSGRLFS
jgi:hypothetical protein